MAEIAEPQSDNEALRRILAKLETVESALTETYSSITPRPLDTIGGEDNETATREASDEIVKTAVTNRGPDNVLVRENGVIVAGLTKFQTWESLLSGSGEILVEIETEGENAQVSIASYIKA